MTNDEFLEKVDILRGKLGEYIMEQAELAAHSGALPLSEWKNNYELPKVFMCALANSIKDTYMPYRDDLKKLVKNLEHFI
jgi:hypothetical protein